MKERRHTRGSAALSALLRKNGGTHTLETLAALLRLEGNTVMQWVSGLRIPREENREHISQTLGIAPNLWGKEESEPQSLREMRTACGRIAAHRLRIERARRAIEGEIQLLEQLSKTVPNEFREEAERLTKEAGS